MTAHSNFIICYNQREGSSAIVSMLSAQNSLCVPLFEDLDNRNFINNHPGETLADVIDQIFRTGHYDTGSRARNLYEFTGATVASIGFKARLFGPTVDLLPVLKRHRVKVFVLSRRDFIEVISSLYISAMGQVEQAKVELAQHPQFKLLHMNDAEKEIYLAEIDAVRLKVRHEKFLALARSFARHRRTLANDAQLFASAGIEIVPVYYEDFVQDRIAFIRSFLTELGFPPDWPIVDSTKFVKVMKSSARSKLPRLGWHPAWLAVMYQQHLYRRQLRRLENLRRQNNA